ncbi:MAG TPA: pyrroline-5-carboxylate reductase [Rickettsiales bacterium]|nr:pyrroline-5-carboxylate reductase [Rickettsiales bacterium]
MQNINLAKILFIGCGKMGSILLNNLLQNGAQISQTKIIDPAFAGADFAGVATYSNAADLPSDFIADFVFICTKPQNSHEILTNFLQAKKIDKNSIIISILAGKKIKFLSTIFGSKVKIVRAMPNIAIQEKQGVVAYYLSKNIKNEEILTIKEIFKNFGEIIELQDEKKFDIFTAIFGSGPAYIFLLQEIFVQIAKENGFDENVAKLIHKLFLGSSLMSQNGEFVKLRESVTSKEGTTDAALQILQKNNALQKLFSKAIKSAVKRSKKLQ